MAGDESPLTVDFKAMMLHNSATRTAHRLRCTARGGHDDIGDGDSGVGGTAGKAAAAATAAAASPVKDDAASKREAALKGLRGSAFEARFRELTLTTSVTVSDSRSARCMRAVCHTIAHFNV